MCLRNVLCLKEGLPRGLRGPQLNIIKASRLPGCRGVWVPESQGDEVFGCRRARVSRCLGAGECLVVGESGCWGVWIGSV